MKNKQGFTLIELLVVVLIIGILAAVAVPQYQKTVKKVRYMELISIGDAIHKAQEAYYMANNSYTNNPDDLDLTVPLPAHISMSLGVGADPHIELSSTKLPDMSYVFYLDQHGSLSFRGRRECRVHNNEERLKQLCRSLTNTNSWGTHANGTVWYSGF